jgi:hypothetical protein
MRTWTRNLQVEVQLVEVVVVVVELGALSWIIELATRLIKSRGVLAPQPLVRVLKNYGNSLPRVASAVLKVARELLRG